ncbi:hypothetical protein GF376_00670 [Candidatus Peregrinibacteria bacterium]|nr:hypothetical protein [Candidatus Peregrinibacteria bacterium]
MKKLEEQHGFDDSFYSQLGEVFQHLDDAGVDLKNEEEFKKTLFDQDSSNSEVDIAVSKISSLALRALEGEDNIDMKSDFLTEMLILLLIKRGCIKKEGKKLFFQYIPKSDVRRMFRIKARQIFDEDHLNQMQVDGVNPEYVIIDLIGDKYDLFNPNGEKINNYHEIFAGGRQPVNIEKVLEKMTLARLRLSYPEQEVTQEEADDLVDEERGILCYFDEQRKVYTRFDSTIAYKVGLRTYNWKAASTFSNSASPLRLSDKGSLHRLPRKLGAKNVTPMFNRTRYYFPTSEFEVDGERIKIDPEKDFVVFSYENTGILIVNSGVYPRYYEFDLTSNPVGQTGFVRAEEVKKSMREFDATNYLLKRSSEDPVAYSRRMKRMNHPEILFDLYRILIDQANVSLQDLDLKSQLLFADYYYGQDENGKNRIVGLLRTFGITFLKAFEVCEAGRVSGDQLIKFVEKNPERAMAVCNHLSTVFHLTSRSEEIGGGLNRMLESVVGKISALMKDLDRLGENSSEEDVEKVLSKYRPETIRVGALFASVSTEKIVRAAAPEKINEKLKDLKIQVMRAGSVLKTDKPRSNSDFVSPEIFGIKDYKKLRQFVEKTYQEIDPGCMHHLLRMMPTDLNNPDYTYILIKDSKGNLIGIIRFKPDERNPGNYYFGNMYVDENFQKGFNMGGYLQGVAESSIPEGATWSGNVSIANTAMERHVEKGNGVARSIEHEKDDAFTSLPMLELMFRGQEYKSKSLSKQDVMSICEGKKKPGKNVAGKVFDTSLGNFDGFVKEAGKYFARGYVITRFFYQEVNHSPNQKKTYVIFEKVPSES